MVLNKRYLIVILLLVCSVSPQISSSVESNLINTMDYSKEYQDHLKEYEENKIDADEVRMKKWFYKYKKDLEK